jgi:hypothetical protein
MRGAVIAHFKHLKDLGMKPAMKRSSSIKELINLTTLIFLLINQGNQHFFNESFTFRQN